MYFFLLNLNYKQDGCMFYGSKTEKNKPCQKMAFQIFDEMVLNTEKIGSTLCARF